MYYRLVLLLLCSTCLFADWEGEEDEDGVYIQTPCRIEYGGMTIFCHWGCGHRLYDPRVEDVWAIVCQTAADAVKGLPLNPRNSSLYDFSTWKVNPHTGELSVYNWPLVNGFYSSKRPYEHFELQTYSQLQTVASLLRRDVHFYSLDIYQQELGMYKKALAQLHQSPYRYAYLNDKGELECSETTGRRVSSLIEDFEEEISCLERKIPDVLLEKYEKNLECAEKAIVEIDSIFRDIFEECLNQHQTEGISFNGALEDFLGGDFEQAISKIRWMIKTAEEHDSDDEMLAKLYFLQGQVQSEFCLYADAIVGLTTAIQKAPSMKEAYFERAFAYFELGQFDQAIEDYLTSGIRPTLTNRTQLGLGIAAGVLRGTGASLVDFVPSMWGAVRNVGEGLWAFAQDPIQVSQGVAEAAVQCVEYLRSASLLGAAQDIVPELRELLQNYDTLEDFQKGKQIGYIIGKYGTEILCAKYSAKAIKAYVNLKKANRLATLEMLTSQEQAQLSIAAKKVWDVRDQVRKGVLKIDVDKQGKHIVGHRNYEKLIKENKNPSILTHSDPQGLVQKFAGTGIKDGPTAPGIAGYVEIINFEETVGYVVEKKTGEKIATTWGKIHYAKDGVHIVPRKPL